MSHKITPYNKAILPIDTQDLCLPGKFTNLELLTYAIALGNCFIKDFTAFIYLVPESLKKFFSVPNKSKIKALVDKKVLFITSEPNLYKLRLPDSIRIYNTYIDIPDNAAIFCSIPDKYKDTDILVYGVLSFLSKTRTVKAKEIRDYLRCDKSTLNKVLASQKDIRHISIKTKKYKGGREYTWHTNTNIPNKSDHKLPDYIVFRPAITDEVDSLNKKLLLAYCYTVVRKKTDVSEEIARHLTGGQYGADKAKEYLVKYKKLLKQKLTKENKLKYLRIPIYSEYSSEELAIMSMLSEFQLKKRDCVWSLQAFKKVFNLPTSRSVVVCKSLLKKKLISKPTKKFINYIGKKLNYDMTKFHHAVTVTRKQNIILNYCNIKKKKKVIKKMGQQHY